MPAASCRRHRPFGHDDPLRVDEERFGDTEHAERDRRPGPGVVEVLGDLAPAQVVEKGVCRLGTVLEGHPDEPHPAVLVCGCGLDQRRMLVDALQAP